MDIIDISIPGMGLLRVSCGKAVQIIDIRLVLTFFSPNLQPINQYQEMHHDFIH